MMIIVSLQIGVQFRGTQIQPSRVLIIVSSRLAVLVDVTYFERIQSESSVINKFDSLPRSWQTYSKFMNIIGSSLTQLIIIY